MPLKIVRQDITKIEVDAIVNTTNRSMVGYSGVDLAVHTAAGQELDALCKRIAPIENGVAVSTPGFGLACKHIIHICGPQWGGGNNNESNLLKSCYDSCLNKAVELGCGSVAFPLISSGAYGCPKDRVLKIAVSAITEFLFEQELTVYICVFDRESYEFSKKLFADIADYIDDVYAQEKSKEFAAVSQTADNVRKRRDFCVREEAVDACEICAQSVSMSAPVDSESLAQRLKELDKGFAETLFAYIDAKGMTDVECYKKANVDKKTFSKIKCNSGYRPSKQTAIAFSIALRLTLEETQLLLRTVGMSLSHSNKFDVIIEYFIVNGNYDIFEINEALFEFDQVLLGC